jgi:hypothetical protein
VRLALREHGVPVVLGEIEPVLDGADRSDGPGHRDLLERDVGDADVPDLAFASEVVECADRLRKGDGRVGDVQLVEIDAIEAKPGQ